MLLKRPLRGRILLNVRSRSRRYVDAQAFRRRDRATFECALVSIGQDTLEGQMSIWPVSIAAVAAVTLLAQSSDAPQQVVVLQTPSCVPTAPMPIRRVAAHALEPMPVTKAATVPAMPTARLIPCYQADSLASAPLR